MRSDYTRGILPLGKMKNTGNLTAFTLERNLLSPHFPFSLKLHGVIQLQSPNPNDRNTPSPLSSPLRGCAVIGENDEIS
jgi:hypothetical protein